MEKAISPTDTSSIVLRDVIASDLPIFFEHQLDPEANLMAAFTAKDPADRDAFMVHWSRNLENETSTIQTILFNEQVVGYVSSYEDEDGRLGSQLLDRKILLGQRHSQQSTLTFS